MNELHQMGITNGDLLTMAGFIGTLLAFHRSNLRKVNAIEFKVGLMWKHFARRFDLPEDLEAEEGKP